MLELYLLKIDLQLFGDQHRDRCICALTHFDVRHDKSDPTVTRDPHESIGLEGLIHARLSFGERGRQAQAQHQTAAGGSSDLQKASAGDAGHMMIGVHP
jgi:hypothetical protein